MIAAAASGETHYDAVFQMSVNLMQNQKTEQKSVAPGATRTTSFQFI